MLKEIAEFIKSITRPFIIFWGFLIWGICILTQVEIPELLAYLISLVILEYFGERAIKRFKGK